jgi:hypothetical protein
MMTKEMFGHQGMLRTGSALSSVPEGALAPRQAIEEIKSKMAVLKPTYVGTKLFTWLPEESLLVAEDSSLPRPSRVWDDACDVGYTLVSHQTNSPLVVTREHVERDREGDILYWEYKPIAPAYHNRFKVRVYND